MPVGRGGVPEAMTAKQIVPGAYMIPLGIVNAYLIEGDRLTLIPLFAADAASNTMGLGLSLGYEDLERGTP